MRRDAEDITLRRCAAGDHDFAPGETRCSVCLTHRLDCDCAGCAPVPEDAFSALPAPTDIYDLGFGPVARWGRGASRAADTDADTAPTVWAFANLRRIEIGGALKRLSADDARTLAGRLLAATDWMEAQS